MNATEGHDSSGNVDAETVELQIRRILDQEGLALSKQILVEAEKYRLSLENQFRHILRLIGIIATIGAGLLVFFFGRSYNELSEQLTHGITEETVKYRILESYQNDLKDRIGIFQDQATAEIEQAITSEKSAAIKELRVAIEAEKEVLAQEIRDNIMSDVARRVDEIVRSDVTLENIQNQWQSVDNLSGRVAQLELVIFPRQGFRSAEEIKTLMKGSVLEPDEEVGRIHLVFSTDKQHTWIMSTQNRVIIYLDDEDSRSGRGRGFLQDTPRLKTEVKRVSARERRDGVSGELDLGLTPGTITLYSQSLFPNPAELERLVTNMLALEEESSDADGEGVEEDGN